MQCATFLQSSCSSILSPGVPPGTDGQHRGVLLLLPEPDGGIRRRSPGYGRNDPEQQRHVTSPG